MIFLVGFFFWFAMSQAYGERSPHRAGRPPIEGEDSAQKVFSWPDLVYVELICLVVVMADDRVVDLPQGSAEEPANPTDFAQPGEGAVVLPGAPGDAVYFDPGSPAWRSLDHHRG
jgi:hypothetical protein